MRRQGPPETCAEIQQPEPGAEPYPTAEDKAWIVGWVVVLVVALVLVDWLWLYRHKKTDLSQGLQRLSRHWHWFGALVLGVLFVAGWHFVFGGPL